MAFDDVTSWFISSAQTSGRRLELAPGAKSSDVGLKPGFTVVSSGLTHPRLRQARHAAFNGTQVEFLTPEHISLSGSVAR